MTRDKNLFSLRTVSANTAWLLADRLTRMAGGFLVGVWVARYLGPTGYGLLSYALALAALFSILPRAGSEETVIHDLVKNPGEAPVILAGAFRLKMAGGIAGFILSTSAAALLRPGDPTFLAAVFLLALGLLFQPLEVFGWYYQARLESRYPVLVRGGAFLLAAAVKVALILSGAPLLALVGAFFLEALLGFSCLLAFFRWKTPGMAWPGVRKKRLLSLWRRTWPMALSGFCVLVYTRIDKIMLGRIVGDAAVGHYAAAGRIAELWYYLPLTGLASAFPALVRARDLDRRMYLRRLQAIYDLAALVSIPFALAIAFSAPFLVSVVFGPLFEGAGRVLSIYIWSTVFALALAIKGQWAVMEGLQAINLACLGGAALLNIALNLLLIPGWGGAGAAAATLGSQFFALAVVPLFHARDRQSAFHWLKSLMPLPRLRRR